MLTADLLRARVRKGAIRPEYVDASSVELLARAEELLTLFQQHENRRRGELDEALNDLVGDETEFAIVRGLCKLLHDRSTWETVAPIDPIELRRALFEASAAAHPVGTRPSKLHTTTRADVLASVAAELGVTVESVVDGMYGDLKTEQRLTRFRPMTAEALIHRYNLALAQGLLLRASEMHIDVDVDRPSALRQLFRWLKFHQLMHRTIKSDSGWRITVDGPLSLFSQSQRYGLQMALFLPALLLADRWRVQADVEWRRPGNLLTLELSPADGLVTHLRNRGTYVTEEERWLTKRIDEHANSWKVSRRAKVVDLGGEDVLVPDFTVECTETGRVAIVEVVGFWRRSYLERRVDVLRRRGPTNLVLCISRKMATEAKAALGTLEANVVEFASVVPLGAFFEAVERVAAPR